MLITGDVVLAGGHLGGDLWVGQHHQRYDQLTRHAWRATGQTPLAWSWPLSTEPARDIERALVTCRQLLSDTRTIFETLSGQEGINKIILSLRDINR